MDQLCLRMVKHLRVTQPDQPSNQTNYKAYPKSSVVQSKIARASSMSSELDKFQNREQHYDSRKLSLMTTQTTKVSFQSLNPISTCLKTLSNTLVGLFTVPYYGYGRILYGHFTVTFTHQLYRIKT